MTGRSESSAFSLKEQRDIGFPGICDGGARAMERSSKISISCLVKCKPKRRRGREIGKREEVLAKTIETPA
jgi:hypothetical protein